MVESLLLHCLNLYDASSSWLATREFPVAVFLVVLVVSRPGEPTA